MVAWISNVVRIAGLGLLLLNIYGLTQSPRSESFAEEDLRFVNDSPRDYSETMLTIESAKNKPDREFIHIANSAVSQGLAHIKWTGVPSTKYSQLVPPWENYFLYAMGRLSGIPEFERYHFVNYRRSLERGIGICGDASMVLTQVLSNNGIECYIVSFPGHVVVEANAGDEWWLCDPDFGVVVPRPIEAVHAIPELIDQCYLAAGYSEHEIDTLRQCYRRDFRIWDGAQEFMTKKHYFEMIAYWLKWPMPVLLIALPSIHQRIARRRRRSSTSTTGRSAARNTFSPSPWCDRSVFCREPTC